MALFSSHPDEELFAQLEVIRDVATNVLERTQQGEELTETGELVARAMMADTKPIIEELQQRGYGTC